MHTKIHWIHTMPNNAKLGIMARPRGDDWLKDEINHLKYNKVNVVVSLLEKEEIQELKLNNESSLCFNENIIYINFPIQDRNVPRENYKTDELIKLLIAKLNEGASIVIHCRMGIGRSSIIAGAILLNYKLTTDEIINNITKIRGLKVPDTTEQLQWLRSREK